MSENIKTYDDRIESVFTFPRTHYFVAILFEMDKIKNLTTQSFIVGGADPLSRSSVIARAKKLMRESWSRDLEPIQEWEQVLVNVRHHVEYR